MKKTEDFIIALPYKLKEEELKYIDKLKEKGYLEPKDWNKSGKGIQLFKRNIYDYLLKKQNSYCAYCRMELNEACDQIPREHIVPKSLHPCWMFEPRNICLSCTQCNNNKKDHEVLENPNQSTYPLKSSSFKIINPYLDKYSEHIKILNDLVYVGLTAKGRFTIKMCKLYRINLPYARAKKKMERECPDIVRALLLSSLSRTEICEIEKNKLLDKINEIVHNYKCENI